MQVRLERRLVVDEADIRLPGVEVPAAMARGEPQHEFRMRLLEAVQARQQPSRRDRHVDLQHELTREPRPAHEIGAVSHAVEGIREDRVEGAPGLAQGDRPALADEQRHPEALLETADLVADRRIGDRELLGREPEAAVTGGRLEGPKRGQGGKPTSLHGMPLRRTACRSAA